jgi:uracil-DNA glycosylase
MKKKSMSSKKIDIDAEWFEVLKDQFHMPYFDQLKNFLISEKQQFSVYPPGNQIFAAFNLTNFSRVKVVILGQDPYHGPGQAHGLCFSVSPGIPHPPSLQNIFKELQSDLGFPYPKSGNLELWARQGVFLLNATLTVRASMAGSHQKKGWELFTDEVISQLSQHKTGLVFILWGSYAQAKSKLIDAKKHHIIRSVHPSPLSVYRGFFGSKPFSKTNNLLIKDGKSPIDWQIL